MKFGAIPETLFERVALKTGRIPIPLLDLVYGPMKAREVMVAVRLGIFDSIGTAEVLAAELSVLLGLNLDCLEMFLRSLVQIGYLQRRKDRFSLSRLGRRTMTSGAATQMCSYVEWNFTQWEMMEHLEDLMRSGKGVDLHRSMKDPEAWACYQGAMLENARRDAEIVASRVEVPKGARSLIDLGGSHGLFGAAVCRKHRGMRSTVFDLEPAIESARELARREKIDNIVSHRAADILRDDLGEDHDVALLVNVLHHFQAEENIGLITRVRNALRTRGTVAIWDFERPKQGGKIDAGDTIALFFRLTSSAGGYHGGEYAGWLRAAGFRHVEVIRHVLIPARVFVRGMR